MKRNAYIMIPYCPCKHDKSKRTLNIVHWIKHWTLTGHLCWISFPGWPLIMAANHPRQSRTIIMFCLKEMRRPIMHFMKISELYMQSRLRRAIILRFFRMYSQRTQNIHLDLKRPHTIANNVQAILKESKQNSHKYAQGTRRYTYHHNHVNEDQPQTAKKNDSSWDGNSFLPVQWGEIIMRVLNTASRWKIITYRLFT